MKSLWIQRRQWQSSKRLKKVKKFAHQMKKVKKFAHQKKKLKKFAHQMKKYLRKWMRILA